MLMRRAFSLAIVVVVYAQLILSPLIISPPNLLLTTSTTHYLLCGKCHRSSNIVFAIPFSILLIAMDWWF
jgi:hypothetical protein